MKRSFRFIVELLFFTSLFSCNLSKIEEFQLGQDFVTSNSGVVLIDTMKIFASTVHYDSIVTSKLRRLLVGGYQNAFTGTVTSMPYFEIKNGTFTVSATDLVYDSLVMKMKYDGYFIGDTTKLISFNVKQIAQKLALNTNGYLYNTSTFQLTDESLGEARFYPHPRSTTDFNIRLSDKFGQVLFNDIINKNDTMQNITYFKEFFKGVALVANENQNQVAIGFSQDSVSLRVYYHEIVSPVEPKVKTYFSFPVDESGIWFNQIIHNANGSLIETIGQNKNELQSSSTSNQTMVQAGNGIYTKIRIPGVDYLKGYGKNVVFISAQVKLTPLKDSYSVTNPLPDSLSVYIVDRKNLITAQFANTVGNIYAIKVVPSGFEKLPYYMIDITQFFNSEIADPTTTDHSLLIGSVAFRSGQTINPIVFADVNSKKDIVKMNVFCYIEKSK